MPRRSGISHTSCVALPRDRHQLTVPPVWEREAGGRERVWGRTKNESERARERERERGRERERVFERTIERERERVFEPASEKGRERLFEREGGDDRGGAGNPPPAVMEARTPLSPQTYHQSLSAQRHLLHQCCTITSKNQSLKITSNLSNFRCPKAIKYCGCGDKP